MKTLHQAKVSSIPIPTLVSVSTSCETQYLSKLEVTSGGHHWRHRYIGTHPLPSRKIMWGTPVSDIWWWSLETCSSLFIWGPPGLTSGDGRWNIRFPSGRYASYWNAFSLSNYTPFPTFLQGYPGSGTRELFRMLQDKPDKIMILGPFPSHIAQAVAQTARWWNLVQVQLFREILYNFWLIERRLSGCFWGFCLKVLRRWRGPANGILLVYEWRVSS